jgi:hypothetical protein
MEINKYVLQKSQTGSLSYDNTLLLYNKLISLGATQKNIDLFMDEMIKAASKCNILRMLEVLQLIKR